MNRADDWRAGIAIPERTSDLLDQHDEGRVGDKGVRPQRRMDFRFGHDSRGVANEQTEEIEGFRRQVRLALGSDDPSLIGIERERSESSNHNVLLILSPFSPVVLTTSADA